MTARSFPEPALKLVAEMSVSAHCDASRAVAFQGAPGANSHRAALEFDGDCLPLPCFSFEDALDAVRYCRVDRAIIPIENSYNGRVADIHFLLPESGLAIVAEYFMPIHHSLMALPGAQGPYMVAYSHPQALGQSRSFLSRRGIVPLAYADTAGAAAFIKEQGNPQACAIAPKLAAKLYGLEIITDNVEDSLDNTTRFLVLSRTRLDAGAQLAQVGGAVAMTTLVFEVRNVPAALYKALGGFATNGVSITKLESYQKGSSFAATTFYADVVGAPGETAVDRALEELAFQSKNLRILGSYRQARERG